MKRKFLFLLIVTGYFHIQCSDIAIADFFKLDPGLQRTWALQSLAVSMATKLPQVFDSHIDILLVNAPLYDIECKKIHAERFTHLPEGHGVLRGDPKVLMLEFLIHASLGFDTINPLTHNQIQSGFITLALSDNGNQNFHSIFTDLKLTNLAQGAKRDDRKYLTTYLHLAQLCMEIFEDPEEHIEWLEFFADTGRPLDYFKPLYWLGVTSKDFLECLCKASRALHSDGIYKRDMRLTKERLAKLHTILHKNFTNLPPVDSEELAILWDDKHHL